MKEYIHALVLSDTHGNAAAVRSVLAANPEADYIFHLGDNVRDARLIEENTRARVVSVKGNCDPGEAANDFEEVVLQGQKIILTHGHLLKVKFSYDRAFYYAQEREAKAILFGHTHRQYCEYVDGIWMVNPGSAGDSPGGKAEYATLLIGEMGVVPKTKKI
ncbi:MAG: metallophosphoesterase [Christensenella sp.]|uniref:metallophosphoesterase n=1 Tax=Christensenella sp. TaxID=1935934 RepID=UPI002B1F0528|nr:metallophosphoesterase [Christensenella sp.]MEA5002202.1 metallophosphoesterase [Christensenella sp.]